jgi:hypothetical protein
MAAGAIHIDVRDDRVAEVADDEQVSTSGWYEGFGLVAPPDTTGTPRPRRRSSAA